MTARSDYLTTLTNAGYTPNRAVLFEEGTGNPVEHYTAVALTPGGTPTWATDGTYGSSGYCDATSDYWSMSGAANPLSTTAQTIILVKRKVDTTARDVFTFGLNTATGSALCAARVPNNISVVRWGFGSSASQLLTYSHSPTTSLECWAFRAGTAGMSIWLNGTQVASHATTVTRTNTGEALYINRHSGTAGDIQEFYFMCYVPAEVSDAILSGATVDNILLGQPPPAISTTTLPDGSTEAVYNETIEATDGVGDLVFSISAGALPSGLSLSSVGVLSGTPTESGLFHFTVTVTDELNHTDVQTYDLYIDDPLCIPIKIGSVIDGVAFAHNSQFGPFENGAKKIGLVFLNSANTKILLAKYSINNGVTWSTVSLSAKSNTISSYFATKKNGETDVKVLAQENSGRVSYQVFSLTSGTWTTSDQEVNASASIQVGVCALETLSGGDVIAFYETNEESVSGTPWRRNAYRRLTSGTWGSEVALGNVGVAQSDRLGGVAAGLENRAYFITGYAPGTSGTADMQVQVLKSTGSLSSINTFHGTGLLGTSGTYFMGKYTAFQDGADYVIYVPLVIGGSTAWYKFLDADTTTSNSTEGGLANFTSGGSGSVFPATILQYIEGQLRSIDWAWPNLGDESWLRYKTEGPSFTPSDMDYQLGPHMGTIGSTTQIAGANFSSRICEGVTSVYIMTAVSIFDDVDFGEDLVKFEWIKVDDIPTNPDQSLNEWLDALASQDVEFCCTDMSDAELTLPTIASTTIVYEPSLGNIITPPNEGSGAIVNPPSVTIDLKSVEILRGSILEADWLKRDLYGADAAVTTPQIFTLEVADKLKLSMLPPPNAVRGLDYIYVPQPTVLTTPSGFTQDIPLPEDFTPFLKFGVLADLFLKSGEAHDPQRGKICQDLYELGIEIARVYVAGINQ